MPPNKLPEIVVFSTMSASDVQAAIRLRKRGMEAQICEIMELCTLMPPAVSSIEVLGFRTMCKRSPEEMNGGIVFISSCLGLVIYFPQIAIL